MKPTNSSEVRNAKQIIVVSILCCLLNTISLCPAQEYIWTRKADMPTARWIHASSVVDGKIYVMGGRPSEPTGGVRFSSVDMYDPVSDTWTRKADLPTATDDLSACSVNDKIYAIGGGYSNPRRTIYEYNPATDTWTRKADMPTARHDPSTSILNGQIYVMGGSNAKNNIYPIGLTCVEVYNPGTDIWTTKADMLEGLWSASSSIANGRIYTIGGRTDATDVVLEYNLSTNTWGRKASIPTRRRGFVTCVLDGKIYAIGGWIHSNAYPNSSVEVYDPKLDLWMHATDMPIARACLSGNIVDGKIYIFGGTNRPHDCIATSDVYELTIIPPPSPDFNNDGIVDSDDESILLDHWDTDYSRCDIAPPPSGDGIVDDLDLVAFEEHMFEDYRLLAHWTFDEEAGETAHDSANWYAGTVHGGAIRHKEGKVGGALYLDGVDDYVSTPYLFSPWASSFSVFAWIKTEIPGQSIVSQSSGTGSTWLCTNPSDGRLVTNLATPWFPPLESDYIISDGRWHYVGLVYDQNGFQRRIYVDGVEVCSDTEIVVAMGSKGGLHIGAGEALDPASFFCGLIDDVRVYKAALSAEEIADPTKWLVAHWRLDEEAGYIAYDSAGENDASLIGTPVWQPKNGKVGGALTLDGVDDWGFTNSIQNLGPGPVSIFAWIKGGGPNQVLISQTLAANWLQLDSAGRVMTKLGETGPSVEALVSELATNDEDWHRIGVVLDGLNRRLYVDGMMVAEDSQGGSGVTTSGLNIGVGKDYLPGSHWSGMIDDIRIYNVALSTEQIAALTQ